MVVEGIGVNVLTDCVVGNVDVEADKIEINRSGRSGESG